MAYSQSGSPDRTALIAAAVVAVTALISLFWAWGALMIVTLLAGVGALFVLYQPRVAPTFALPGSKGSLLTALGIAAAAASILTALYWLGYITSYLVSIDTIVFLVSVIASVVLAWSGWQILKAEGGKFRFGAASPMSAPPAADMSAPPAADMSAPPAETPPQP